MTRILLLTTAVILAGCNTPDLPDGPDGSPRWYDEQLDSASRTTTPPETIPNRPLNAADDARRASSTETVLERRDALNAEERAQPVNPESEQYADQERVRTTPPERDD